VEAGNVSGRGWIAVDLDGTIAQYHGWKGSGEIGQPIPLMVRRVKRWLAYGNDVRIFTARVNALQHDDREISVARSAIESWCKDHIGVALPITNVKDHEMVELWDDRAVRVEKNTGRRK
jgi:hypothetical protein